MSAGLSPLCLIIPSKQGFDYNLSPFFTLYFSTVLIPHVNSAVLKTMDLIDTNIARYKLSFIPYLLYPSSASVVSGERARLEIQGSRVQIRLRSIDFFFQDVKILTTSLPGDFKLGIPNLRFQAR